MLGRVRFDEAKPNQPRGDPAAATLVELSHLLHGLAPSELLRELGVLFGGPTLIRARVPLLHLPSPFERSDAWRRVRVRRLVRPFDVIDEPRRPSGNDLAFIVDEECLAAVLANVGRRRLGVW